MKGMRTKERLDTHTRASDSLALAHKVFPSVLLTTLSTLPAARLFISRLRLPSSRSDPTGTRQPIPMLSISIAQSPLLRSVLEHDADELIRDHISRPGSMLAL